MKTKTATVLATTMKPELLQSPESAPARWLDSMEKEARTYLGAGPADQVLMHGFNGVSFSTTRQMTPAEVQDERIAALEAQLAAEAQAAALAALNARVAAEEQAARIADLEAQLAAAQDPK